MPFAALGDREARLLAGPARGTESLPAHTRRLGPVDALSLDDVSAAGLTGRGGGAFPLGAKLQLAAASPGAPLVIVNASEGEPASRKDKVLLGARPHLVLDGAQVAASAIGSREVVVYIHSGRPVLQRIVANAVAERGGSRGGVHFRIVLSPNSYLAGESSALASFLDSGSAIPRASSRPLAAMGVGGRPTVVSNAETLAHLALVARFGADWWRQAGCADAPGSTLVTLAGDVATPGLVAEVLEPHALGDLLCSLGGWEGPPRAVLLGGYAGTWLCGRRAWTTVLDRQHLRAAGASFGCGVVAVIGEHRCGLAETARLMAWLAGETAGQCGPCARGMPLLAGAFNDLVRAGATRRQVHRAHELAASIIDRGLCHLPDGAALLAETALGTFDDELRSHRWFRRCTRNHGWDRSPLPLPASTT